MKIFKMIFQLLILLQFIFVPSLLCQSDQNIAQMGNPFIRNYSPNDYSGGSQNWCTVQDNNGILYFGNTKGVLQFDGINWKIIQIGDGKAVFSLAIDSTGTIWCGSHDDVGFLEPDSLGKLSYVSITHLIADSLKPFGRVRQLIPTKNGLFLRTSKYFMRINNKSIKVWKTKTNFYKMQYVNNRIYIYENSVALKTLVSDSLVILPGGEFFKDKTLTGVLAFDRDTLLIVTWKDGLFLYSDGKLNKLKLSIEPELKNNPIIEAMFLSEDRILLAGFNKGSYVINRNGILQQKFNKSAGLLDEYCNSTFLDQSNGLWFCNNFGISRVEINSPFSNWGENKGITTNIRFITRFNNKILAASSDKVYSLTQQTKKKQFVVETIPGLNNCWFLLPIGNIYLAATSDGVYEVKNSSLRLLSRRQKKSLCLLQSQIDSNKVFVGTTQGIALLTRKENDWIYNGLIPGVKAEIRQMYETQNGTLWLGTHNQGIIKCEINDSIANGEFIKRFDGFDDFKSYRFSSIDEQLLFYSPYTSTLIYNENKNEFYNDTLLFNPQENISRIAKEKDGNIWVRKSTTAGTKILYGKKKDKFSYKFETVPYNRLIGLNAQYIFPDENNNTWFGTRFGLVKYDSSVPLQIPKQYAAQIRQVKSGESILFEGHNKGEQQNVIPELPYLKNAIRFAYSLAAFESREALTFQYYLEGYEDKWSDWTYETQKDYTNLFEGKYKFYVRGKDIYGNVSTEGIYKFKILPPWYRSVYAYLSYLLLFVISIFVVDRVRTKQHNKKNEVELERKLKQQQAIEKAKSDERQRVRKKTAADFHDELGHLLTRITLSTEMVRKNSKENNSVHDYLSNIVKSTSQLSSGMKDLIWTLDSNKDTLLDTLIRIKDFGDTLFENSQISFISHGFLEEFEQIKMNMDKRRHLVLIFKEVMNNCLKYSKSKTAEFNAVIIKNDILISFIDDGIGFTDENKSSGNGLKNIKMRAKSIDAKIIIDSNVNQTNISLLLINEMKNSSNG